MKLSVSVLLSAVVCSCGFTAPTSLGSRDVGSSLRLSDQPVESADTRGFPTSSEDNSKTDSVLSNQPQMSQSIPFLQRPAALDGSMVGDVGFDPMGFAQTTEDLVQYREAEIKHGRLAMLAAAGWPLSEVFDRQIADGFGMTPLLDGSDRVPSVLNGGLDKVSPFYWALCLGAAAAIDVYGIKLSRGDDPNYFPGNLGFDPLGLYPIDKVGQERMQLAELKHGRLAMIAITAFAAQEFVSQLGVVQETPIFFKPIGTILG